MFLQFRLQYFADKSLKRNRNRIAVERDTFKRNQSVDFIISGKKAVGKKCDKIHQQKSVGVALIKSKNTWNKSRIVVIIAASCCT